MRAAMAFLVCASYHVSEPPPLPPAPPPSPPPPSPPEVATAPLIGQTSLGVPSGPLPPSNPPAAPSPPAAPPSSGLSAEAIAVIVVVTVFAVLNIGAALYFRQGSPEVSRTDSENVPFGVVEI